jgi:glycosyltransferase involved in cell wall biosynthesis
VVVPVFNESESLTRLVESVREALGSELDWELLLVNDGSTDGTGKLADRLSGEDPRIRPLHLARNFGQTAALQAGFENAVGEVVVTMDGDLQNDPADIPNLLAKLDEGYDLVAGYRVSRQDTLVTRKVPSAAANALIRRLTGVPIRDNGCSLKAYRREVVERLHLYSDLHRFIPAVAAATSGATTRGSSGEASTGSRACGRSSRTCLP